MSYPCLHCGLPVAKLCNQLPFCNLDCHVNYSNRHIYKRPHQLTLDDDIADAVRSVDTMIRELGDQPTVTVRPGTLRLIRLRMKELENANARMQAALDEK